MVALSLFILFLPRVLGVISQSINSHIMANTFTQMNVHAVFAVKDRENIITRDFRDELHKYLHGILTGIKQYPLAVNG